MNYLFKFLLCIIFFATNVSFVVAQTNKEVDSLLKRLDVEQMDSSRQKIYNRIGRAYMYNNAKKAIIYFTQALELAKKTNNDLQTANNYYSIGYCNLQIGDFDKSLDNYFSSTKLYEKINDEGRLVNALMSIGNVYFKNSSLSKSNEYYDKCEVLIKKLKDSTQLGYLYAERGLVYDQLKKYDTAIIYLQNALQISKAIGDEVFTGDLYSNMGLTYKHLKNEAKALQYFDSVKIYYKKVTDLPLDNTAALFNNIGATYAQIANYTAAKDAFTKSIEYGIATGNRSIEMENYLNLSDMYGNMKNYEQQAVFLKKYYNLKDSLFTTDSKNQLTQLEADYQIEKKNGQLEKEKLKTIKQENQRNIFIVLALTSLSVLGGLFYFYRRIKQSNIAINTQKDELQKLNQVKDRLFSILSHDLRNPLVTLQSYLTLSDHATITPEKKELYKQQTHQAVTQTSNMLDNLLVWATMQIKNTTPALLPINVADCVEDAISAVKAQSTQKSIEFVTQIEVNSVVSEYNILLIALRNILTNAVKYSPANSRIWVNAGIKNEKKYIAIIDEGVGLSQEQINDLLNNEVATTIGTQGEKGSGLGLFLVKELLQKTNALLHIESEKDKGSTFSIIFS